MQELKFKQLISNQLLDLVNDVVWLATLDNQLLYVNPAIERIYGRPAADFRADPDLWLAMIHPADQSLAHRSHQELHQHGRAEVTYRIVRADGQIRWLRDQKYLICDDSGQPCQIGGIATDVTTERQAEVELRIQHEVALALHASADLTSALEHILQIVCRIEGVDCGGVYLVNPANGGLELAVQRGLSPQFIERTAYYDAASPQSRQARTGQARYGTYADLRPETDEVRESEGLLAIASIPIMHQSELIAALNLASHTNPTIPGHTRTLLETLALQIGSVLTRLRSEAELRQSQQNLQTLFNTLDDFMFVLDGDGCIQQVNRVVNQRLGYSSQELIGQSVLMVHPPERRDEAAQIVAAMLTGDSDFCPVPLQTRDGKLIQVETRVTQGTWSGQPALFGISRDVTRRKLAEKALLASERKFRSIIEHSADAIMLADESGQIVEWNAAAEQLFGLSRIDTLGQAMWDVQFMSAPVQARTPARHKLFKTHLQTYLKTGQMPKLNQLHEFEIERPDGSRGHIQNRAFSIKTELGFLLGSISRDITTSKQAEIEQEQLIEQLQTALAQVKQLSGLLPICSSCKKIRNDQGYWQQVEVYIRDHSEAEFTHGICPDCMRNLYPEFIR